jgi:solute carrier family 23 (nucleobase transporter), member 1
MDFHVESKYRIQWRIKTLSHTGLSFLQVGTYRTTSLQVNSRPPTPGVVSRGIALEGFCSILAGLWGSGTGSTTLTENMHTINITKVASRRVVELGAVFLILFSFVGKVTTLGDQSP